MDSNIQDEVDYEDFLSTIRENWPLIVSKFATELSVMTGKPIATESELESMAFPENLFANLLPLAKELESFSWDPSSQESSEKIYRLLNEYMRLCTGDSLDEEPPLKSARRRLEELVEPPTGIVVPYELDLLGKHETMRAFVYELVEEVPIAEIEDYLQDVVTKRRIVAQIQRATNERLFPSVFLNENAQIDVESTELLKSAFSEVLADWEQAVNLVYGLVCIRKGTAKNWSQIQKVSLGNKVASIEREKGLGILVDPAWVTVRNSIDHGSAYLDPSIQKIRFPDSKREEIWDIGNARREGSNIALSNLVMLQVINFVAVAKNSDLFKVIDYLERQVSPPNIGNN